MDVLQKPLYIFDLPQSLLDSLVVKGHQTHVEAPVLEQPKSEDKTQSLSKASATSCNLCNATFDSVQEQRQHVKSDFHKFNLKQKIKGLQAVSETEFEKLIEDLNESISGSDTSDEDTDEEDRGKSTGDMLSNLLKKQAKISNNQDTASTRTVVGPGNLPLVWLESPSLPPNMSLGVYRVLFLPEEQEKVVETIRRKQLSPVSVAGQGSSKNKAPILPSKTPTYFLCMIGGGHFAAMVVALAPKLVAKHNASMERQAIVLAHKTFHRYTTRRKQGGAQSTSDAAKGAAHSAGSSLRRANEVALTAEVRALLTEWKALIDDCELIFVRATGNTNRRTLFGPYDGQVLNSKDTRNKGFPFTTRRATQSELMRAFVELTRVKVSQVDEASLQAITDAQKASSDASAPPKQKQVPKQPPKPSPEEEARLLHTSQLASLIKRSKVPALLSYIKNNSINVNELIFSPETQYYHTPTVLHYASSLGSVPVLSALLTKCNADPTARNVEGKTAADIAHDRATRDVFRLARHELGEQAFSWDSAGVGPALSSADANARAAKEREEAETEAQREAERRKAATERLRKEDEAKEEANVEKKFGKGNLLSKELTGTEKRATQQRDMTPAMIARLEREQRARAAEERMRRARGGGT
jgi:Bacteroidetes VLRF1 release factor